MDKRLSIAQIVTGLAEYYDKPLSASQLAMYVEDLADVNPQDLVAAVKTYRTDAKNDRFPLPAKLKAMANPELDPEQYGVIVANEIVEAIQKTGPYQTPNLSDTAQQVVKMEGGWQTLCEVVTNDNLGTFKAQWRNLARALAGRQNFKKQLTPLAGPNRPALEFGKIFRDMPKVGVEDPWKG